MRPSRPPQHPADRPTGPRARARAPLLLMTAMLVGCTGSGSDRPASGLTRAEFVDLVVAIREAESALQQRAREEEMEEDSVEVRFGALRDSILAAHGATEDDLYEFLERHTDLHYMNAVWDSITRRLVRPLTPPGDAAPSRERSAPDDSGRGPPLRPEG